MLDRNTYPVEKIQEDIKQALLHDKPDYFLELVDKYNLNENFQHYDLNNPDVRNWILTPEMTKKLSVHIYGNIGNTIDKKDYGFFNNIQEILLNRDMLKMDYSFYRKMLLENEENVSAVDIVERFKIMNELPVFLTSALIERYFIDCILYRNKGNQLNDTNKNFNEEQIEVIVDLMTPFFEKSNNIDFSYFFRVSTDKGYGYNLEDTHPFTDKSNQQIYLKLSNKVNLEKQEIRNEAKEYIAHIFKEMYEHAEYRLYKSLPVINDICKVTDEGLLSEYLLENKNKLQEINSGMHYIKEKITEKYNEKLGKVKNGENVDEISKDIEYLKSLNVNLYNLLNEDVFSNYHKECERTEEVFFTGKEKGKKVNYSVSDFYRSLNNNPFLSANTDDMLNTILEKDHNKTIILKELLLTYYLNNIRDTPLEEVNKNIEHKLNVFYQKVFNNENPITLAEVSDIVDNCKEDYKQYPQSGDFQSILDIHIEKLFINRLIQEDTHNTLCVDRKRL